MSGIQISLRGRLFTLKLRVDWLTSVAVVAAVMLAGGCAEKRARAYPWATAIRVQPHVPARSPGYNPPPLEVSGPDLAWDFPATTVLTSTRQPARPRVPVAQPTPEPENTKAEAPLLAPQLSEREIAAAQQQMNESIAVAQRNLSSARNRSLNPTQNDLASKVSSFLEESKVAVRDGDWTRAKNLAKKAEVLSEELAQTL